MEAACGLLAARAGGASTTARWRRRHGGRSDWKRGVGGAAHDGECGGAHGRTRGSPKRWGRDGGQLGHGGRGHGCSVLTCVRRGRALGRARASAGCVVTLGHSYLEAQGAGRRVAWSSDARRPWGASSGAWQPHRQNVEHVASVGVGKVGAELGRIWADLDLRPKTKFVHLGLLYIFH